jgi:hypothetical protein
MLSLKNIKITDCRTKRAEVLFNFLKNHQNYAFSIDELRNHAFKKQISRNYFSSIVCRANKIYGQKIKHKRVDIHNFVYFYENKEEKQ